MSPFGGGGYIIECSSTLVTFKGIDSWNTLFSPPQTSLIMEALRQVQDLVLTEGLSAACEVAFIGTFSVFHLLDLPFLL